MGAYRRADFSRSYPIARGVAPLLVSLGGLVFANEHLSPRSLAGMLVIAFAITSLALHRREPATRRLGVVWALATGVAIAIYTVIDGLGVRVSHDAFRYAGALFAIESTLWMIGVFASGRRDWWPTRGRAALGLLAGLLSIVGYVAVLWAQIRAPFGVVSALRETGVLWAAIIGVVVFREGRVRRIIVPAMLVTLGIALVSIG
jgi:drug/metabolite transporter (DMT)-like permease